MANGGIYIPVYCDLQHHPKMKRLCRILGKTTPEDQLLLRAKLENLWMYSVLYFPNGIIPSTDEEIAAECLWFDTPTTFVNALCDSGFAKRIDEGGIEIHGWDKYGGKLIIRREKSAEYTRKHRENSSASALRKHDVMLTSDDVSMERKEKNRENESDKKTSLNSLDSDQKKLNGSEKLKQAEEIYQLYPKHVGKAAAIKAAIKVLSKIDYDSLKAKVVEYANSGFVKTSEKQFIPNPSTWFNQERWLDDPETWKANSSPPETSSEEKKAKLRQQYDSELEMRIKKLNAGFEKPAYAAVFIQQCEAITPVHRLPEQSRIKLTHWVEYAETVGRNGINLNGNGSHAENLKEIKQ